MILSDDNPASVLYLEIKMKVTFSTLKPINTTNFKSKNEQQAAPVSNHPHKKGVNPASLTGWIAAASMATAVVSAVLHKPKLHKVSAFTGVAAVAAHIGIIEAYHNIKKHG